LNNCSNIKAEAFIFIRGINYEQSYIAKIIDEKEMVEVVNKTGFKASATTSKTYN